MAVPAPRIDQRLRPWLMTRLALVMLMALLVLAGMAAWTIDAGFDAIEREILRDRLSRAATMLSESTDGLEQEAVASAARPALREAARMRDRAALEGLFDAGTRALLLAEIVAVIADDGSIEMLIDDTRHARTGSHDHSGLGTLLASSVPAGGADSGERMLWLDRMPLVVGYARFDADSGGGWLALSRAVPVFITQHGPSGSSAMRLVPASAGGAELFEERGENVQFGSVPVGNWPARLELSRPGTYAGYRRNTLLWIVGGLVLVGLLLMGAMAWLLRRRVLLRLERFAALAAAAGERDASVQRWPVQGNDELDKLALALNRMVDEVAQRDRQIDHLVREDPLTGLGNRRGLIEQLQSALEHQHEDPGAHYSLLLINLDHFKEVLHVSGLHAGDRVLTAIGQRLRALLRGTDYAARIGGDEFALLLADSPAEGALRSAERVLGAVRTGIPDQDQFLFLTASIGVLPLFGLTDAHFALGEAESALAQAKEAGGDRYHQAGARERVS